MGRKITILQISCLPPQKEQSYQNVFSADVFRITWMHVQLNVFVWVLLYLCLTSLERGYQNKLGGTFQLWKQPSIFVYGPVRYGGAILRTSFMVLSLFTVAVDLGNCCCFLRTGKSGIVMSVNWNYDVCVCEDQAYVCNPGYHTGTEAWGLGNAGHRKKHGGTIFSRILFGSEL